MLLLLHLIQTIMYICTTDDYFYLVSSLGMEKHIFPLCPSMAVRTSLTMHNRRMVTFSRYYTEFCSVDSASACSFGVAVCRFKFRAFSNLPMVVTLPHFSRSTHTAAVCIISHTRRRRLAWKIYFNLFQYFGMEAKKSNHW